MHDTTGFKVNGNEAIVISSFYPTPDGRSSVRAYEIKSSNPEMYKIRKDELNEPRFELHVSKAFNKFKSFFIGSEDQTYSPSSSAYSTPRRFESSSENLNIKKGMAYHTKRDGGVVAVTSLDLSNQNGDNSALKEFAQRKAILDRMNNNNSLKQTVVSNQYIAPVVITNSNPNILKAPQNQCMCLDCQAKIRRGIPYGSFECKCLDCLSKKKAKR